MAVFKPKKTPITKEQRKELIEKSNEAMKNFKPAPEPKPIKSVIEKKPVAPKLKPKLVTQPVPRPIHFVRLEPPKLVTQDLRGRGSVEYRGREDRV